MEIIAVALHLCVFNYRIIEVSTRYLGWLIAYIHGSMHDTVLAKMAGNMVDSGVSASLEYA